MEELFFRITLIARLPDEGHPQMVLSALVSWLLIGALFLGGALWCKHIAPHRARMRIALAACVIASSVIATYCWQAAHQPTLKERLVGKPLAAAIHLLGEPDTTTPQDLSGEHWLRWSRGDDMPGVISIRSQDGTIIEVEICLRG